MKKQVEALKKYVRNESITLSNETSDYYELEVSLEMQARRVPANIKPPYVPIRYKLWIRKESPYVITFGVGRRQSKVGILMLSYATTSRLDGVDRIVLYKEDFLRLIKWILDNNGHIRRITLDRIKEKGDVELKQLVLSAERLEDSELFEMGLRESSVIKNLAFLSPPLESSGRNIYCRLSYWGSLTVYTKDLKDFEFLELIRIFEDIFYHRRALSE